MSSTSSDELWLLADCNNFYASCERLFRPDLTGKPVVVLSNNDGCVIARSAEAKLLGIPMGIAEFKIRPLLRQGKVAVFSSNFPLYGDLSNRVMQTLASLCSDVRQYSIDEAFCRLRGAEAVNADELAAMAKERVGRWTGIPISIGLSCTKTLAKLANHIAKKSGCGVYQLMPSDADFRARLEKLPTGEVWGIGSRLARKLASFEICTVWQLSQVKDAWLRSNFPVTVWNTVLELRGIPAVSDGEVERVRQTLVVSRSFGKRIENKDKLLEALAVFTERALERLRKERMLARGLSVNIQTSAFDADGGYANSASTTLPFSSADTTLFLEKTKAGLDAIWKPDLRYARAGVMLFELERSERKQMSLMEPLDEKKNYRLMETLDKVNARYGHRSLVFAASGLPKDKTAPWRMNQSNLSPARTTNWAELAEVKA